MATRRDLALARHASSNGAAYSLRIILEARRYDLPISLGFALIEQESSFRNVFGHDPTIFVGAGAVTEAKYRAYLRARGAQGRGGMQGVGPAQLTWWEFQDRADELGGCWRPSANIRAGFERLSDLIRRHGKTVGIARYNGSGPKADAYSRSVRARADRWHRILSSA